MADPIPMDFTMDEGHGEPARNSNSLPQCQYRSPHPPPNSNSFASQSQNYDPVHNADSWHQTNGAASQSRQPHPYVGTHNISQWATSSWGMPSWPGLGEAHRAPQGVDIPAYPQPPGFMGMPHPSSWGEMRGHEPQVTSFGYIPGIYGGNSDSAEQMTPGRSSQTTSTLPQVSTMRRYSNIGQIQQAYVERAARSREEAVRNLNARMRAEREASGTQPNTSSFGYLHSHSSLDSSHPRRRDNPDWDSDDDDDQWSAPDSDIHTNPYRAVAMFSGDMDNERRMAVARASLIEGKKVPSREFVASLEKLDPKDIKEADRTCMICYNEFGIENPDGIVEQPISLPKCKHVFGDKCIKKWFEDSDSCPYCRDKLPAEPVHKKYSSPIDAIYQTQSRRSQLAQAAAQPHGSRARAGYPARASDELNYGSSPSQYYRHSQDEYHYIMRGSGGPDPWTYSPSNRARESPENRRRQARGRAGLGRPTSVSSTRLISSNPPNPQHTFRAHLQSITTNTLNTNPANTPRRSITPALQRQSSTGSAPAVVTPPRSRLLEASSVSEEAASPPVAVGSGIAPDDHSPPSAARTYRDYMHRRWADPYHNYLTPNESYFPPGRPPNSRADMEHSVEQSSPEARSTGSSISPHSFGDLNFPGSVHEALNGNRWSR